MPQHVNKHKQPALKHGAHGRPSHAIVHGPVRNAKYPEPCRMAYEGCSYCDLRVAKCLVKCLVCNRFFCNGNTDSTSGQKDSHIVTHLRTSKHRRIAVFDLTKDVVGPLLELRCGKKDCGKNDAFELGMAKKASVFDAEQIFCRPCAVTGGNYHRRDWVPFVDCHHHSLKCFNERIVEVPSITMRHRSVPLAKIVEIERTWMIQLFDLKIEETGTENFVEKVFESSDEYREHFLNLIKLENDLEGIDCLSFPRLDVSINDHTLKDEAVSTIRFETSSQLHCSTFRKGVQTTVHLESADVAVPYRGRVLYQRNLDNGLTVFEIALDMWGTRPTERDLKKAKVSIGLAQDSTGFKRQQKALERFAGRKDDEIKTGILGTGEDKENNGPDPTKSESDNQQAEEGVIAMMQPPGQNLNDSQKEAVQTALRFSLSLIQGPPGTGKTHTTVALVYSLLKARPKTKVLCCAPSNDPTDHLAVQLAKYFPEYEVTRVNSGRVVHEELSDDVRKLTMHHKLQALLGSHYEKNADFDDVRDGKDEIVERSNIICTTCNSVALGVFDNVNFPYVIIDEATQASECDVMIAISRGCTKLVMIGDHKQLGVINKFRELEKSNLGLSMFERLMELKQAPSRMLSVQYRMHPIIAQPPSAVIYKNSLRTGPDVAALRKSDLLHCLLGARPMGWVGQWPVPIMAVDTSNFHELAADAVSLLNGQEAILVALVLSNLLHRGVKAEDVGVITFYNGQKGHLAREVERHYCINDSAREKIMIDSVDAFQGREKDFIILSCVRSGNKQRMSIGFLRDQRRLNVALTRAKKGVVIVGNLDLLRKDKVWSQVLDYYPVVPEKSFVNKLGGLGCSNCQRNKQLPDMPDFIKGGGKVYNNSSLVDLSSSQDFPALANGQRSSGQMPAAWLRPKPAVKPVPMPRKNYVSPPVQPKKKETPKTVNPGPAKPNYALQSRTVSSSEADWEEVSSAGTKSPPSLAPFPKLPSTAGSSASSLSSGDSVGTPGKKPAVNWNGINFSQNIKHLIPIDISNKVSADKPSHVLGPVVSSLSALSLTDLGFPTLSSLGSVPKVKPAATNWTLLGGGDAGKMVVNEEWKPVLLWTDEEFYEKVAAFKLNKNQRGKEGYPTAYKQLSGTDLVTYGSEFTRLRYYFAECNRVAGLDVTPEGPERTCDRCSVFYTALEATEVCVHHWGKKKYDDSKPAGQPIKAEKKQQQNGLRAAIGYVCCDGGIGSTGCTTESFHVSRTYPTMKGFVTTIGTRPVNGQPPQVVLAVDCEMLYTVDGFELGCVTIVDRHLETVYDCFVKPKARIVDCNTRFSGLKLEDFESKGKLKVKSLEEVHKDLVGKLVCEETCLVGQSLNADLLSLKIIHNSVVDTALLFRKKKGGGLQSLKTLMKEVLNESIQDSVDGHDSAEDAKACMKLIMWKLAREAQKPAKVKKGVTEKKAQ